MRSAEERGDRPEGFHQISDQSDLTGPRKPHSKQYGDGQTHRQTNKVSYSHVAVTNKVSMDGQLNEWMSLVS